jgi:Skp family chaperone for outer membrane proteins
MKKTFLFAVASVALAAAPAVVHAQAATGILIVDTDTVMQSCTACSSARAQLESQANALQTRRNTLAQQFQTEAQSIDAEAKALGGKAPGPALKAKAQALQTKEDQAQQELQNSAATIQSTQAHVQQQIGEKLVQVVEQVRAQRRAAIVLSKNATLANDQGLDVTSEVLSALNQQLPSVSVTPMPQQQTTGQTQGR